MSRNLIFVCPIAFAAACCLSRIRTANRLSMLSSGLAIVPAAHSVFTVAMSRGQPANRVVAFGAFARIPRSSPSTPDCAASTLVWYVTSLVEQSVRAHSCMVAGNCASLHRS